MNTPSESLEEQLARCVRWLKAVTDSQLRGRLEAYILELDAQIHAQACHGGDKTGDG